jgi:hypothetical protein
MQQAEGRELSAPNFAKEKCICHSSNVWEHCFGQT